MNDADIKAYHRGAQQFEKYIMNYERKQGQLENIQRQKNQVVEAIEKKHIRSVVNNMYRFPRGGDGVSESSEHPSLVTPEFNLNQYSSGLMMKDLGEDRGNNSSRKIMNLKKIRDLIIKSKEKDTSLLQTTAKKEFSNVNISEEIVSPRSNKNRIKTICKIQNLPTSSLTASSPAKKFNRKIMVLSSVQKYSEVKGLKTQHKQNQRSKEKNRSDRVHSITNITFLKRKEEEFEQLLNRCSKDNKQTLLFNCCEQKPQQTAVSPRPYLKKDYILQKREIKIITSKQGHRLRSHDRSNQCRNYSTLTKPKPPNPPTTFLQSS